MMIMMMFFMFFGTSAAAQAGITSRSIYLWCIVCAFVYLLLDQELVLPFRAQAEQLNALHAFCFLFLYFQAEATFAS
jgi:hypothetical protein